MNCIICNNPILENERGTKKYCDADCRLLSHLLKKKNITLYDRETIIYNNDEGISIDDAAEILIYWAEHPLEEPGVTRDFYWWLNKIFFRIGSLEQRGNTIITHKVNEGAI